MVFIPADTPTHGSTFNFRWINIAYLLWIHPLGYPKVRLGLTPQEKFRSKLVLFRKANFFVRPRDFESVKDNIKIDFEFQIFFWPTKVPKSWVRSIPHGQIVGSYFQRWLPYKNCSNRLLQLLKSCFIDDQTVVSVLSTHIRWRIF